MAFSVNDSSLNMPLTSFSTASYTFYCICTVQRLTYHGLSLFFPSVLVSTNRRSYLCAILEHNEKITFPWLLR